MAEPTTDVLIDPVADPVAEPMDGAMDEPMDEPIDGAMDGAMDGEAPDPVVPFWERIPLEAMSDAQWESLCDGCGRCCLQKLQDEDTGQVHFTRIACRELHPRTSRCRHYSTRFERVADCLSVRPLNEEKLGWLPSSCAYRRLAEGRGLADWHPLVSGDVRSVAAAGISMRGRTLAENAVPLHHWQQHVIEMD